MARIETAALKPLIHVGGGANTHRKQFSYYDSRRRTWSFGTFTYGKHTNVADLVDAVMRNGLLGSDFTALTVYGCRKDETHRRSYEFSTKLCTIPSRVRLSICPYAGK